MDRNLVFFTWSLSPRLLSDHPHASARSWVRLGRLLSDDEFESRHRLQPSFEGGACLNMLQHTLIVHSLGLKCGIV